MSESPGPRKARKPYSPPRVKSLEQEELLKQLGPAQASAYVFDPTPVGAGTLGQGGPGKSYREI